MSFHSQTFDFQAAPVMADQFCDHDAVSYQSANPDDDPIVVAGVVGPEEADRRRDKNGALELVRVRSIMLRDSSLARSAIQANGIVTVDGKAYAITAVSDIVGETYTLELERTAKGEITREGYRRK